MGCEQGQQEAGRRHEAVRSGCAVQLSLNLFCTAKFFLENFISF